MEREIMETVLRDMLQELEQIKQQKQHLVKLEESLETQCQLSLRIERKFSALGALPITLTGEQLTTLKFVLKQYIDAVWEDLRKRPVTFHNHKYISLLPPSFRMEHFPLLVNTIMKWVVILIALFFCIWLIVHVVK